MNKLREFLEMLTEGELPAGAMLAIAIVLLLTAVKVTKGFMKFVLVVLALIALAGAVWWYYYKR